MALSFVAWNRAFKHSGRRMAMRASEPGQEARQHTGPDRHLRARPKLEATMPEILFPGVYVAEVAFEATAIEGVATSTDSVAADSPAKDRPLASVPSAPAWTDANPHDPGIGTLTLLAWTLDALSFRAEAMGEPQQHRTAVDRDWP
jgi:hypothetical protein